MPPRLEHQEVALLTVLVEILADGRELERDELRVKVASRGIELGRAYFRLFERGLIIERDYKPGFLKRLFGSKAGRFVSLPPAAFQFFSTFEANIDSVDVKAADAQSTTPERLPRDLDVLSGPVSGASNSKKTSALPPQQRRFAPTDYTDELGGTPDEPVAELSDDDLIQGLTELLSLLGFELTPAGKLLASSRAAANVSEAEIALEVLVAAIAHASRLSLMGTVQIAEGPARAQIAEINKVFVNFVEEHALLQSSLDTAVKTMMDFIMLDEPSAALDAYLADAMRGLAPPAVCPDEMFIVLNVDEDQSPES